MRRATALLPIWIARSLPNASTTAAVRAERESRRADELDREAKHARHVLWAVVMASGGRVEVATELLATSPHDCTFTREIDQFKSCYVFVAK